MSIVQLDRRRQQCQQSVIFKKHKMMGLELSMSVIVQEIQVMKQSAIVRMGEKLFPFPRVAWFI
jgi:hypothetical protein